MTSLLKVEGLSKSFGGLEAVANLSFEVEEGQILGIIGPNGAGKTTAVNLVSGVIKPTSGRVMVGGKDVTGQAPHVLVETGLVRTFQSTTVYGAQTVRENLMRGAFRDVYPGLLATLLSTPAAREMRTRADAHVAEVMQWLDLARVGDQVASNLPYGFQKVLGMGIGLAARPRLILLDEPAAGLSAEETDHVRDTIRLVRDRGISVVVIDHNMRFIADLCDRVLVMAQGRELAQGKPQDVLRNAGVIEAYLGKRYAQAQH
ncbi:MAG TPA: ABC transporter ATP-binding protein [Hyphomicrobiaceae bacterium]|nr:ABC transporter ATP-binding protein [Hyphomicrobiaceae bacterium]